MLGTPPSLRRQQGNEAETLVAEYLRRRGYTVLHRNLQTPYGEIDILAKKDGEYICVEVRSRRTKVPEELQPEFCFSRTKYSHLVRALISLAFLQNKPVRIDLVTVEGNRIRAHYQAISV